MKLNEKDKNFLDKYNHSKYEKPSVTVDAVILRLVDEKIDNYRKLPKKKLQVYLAKRKKHPYINHFSVIGTFIDLKNELSKTMKMCVNNKVNLKNYYFEQLFTFGDKSRDPRTRVLSVSYMVLTNETEKLSNGEWFDIDLIETSSNLEKKENGFLQNKTFSLRLESKNTKLENKIEVIINKNGLKENKEIITTRNNLGFDHGKLIFYALNRLKNKLEYSDIIFNLLPSKFTLTELKYSYEAILKENLLDANFRRKTSKFVIPTSKYVRGKGHRSSRLFKINPNWKLLNIE